MRILLRLLTVLTLAGVTFIAGPVAQAGTNGTDGVTVSECGAGYNLVGAHNMYSPGGLKRGVYEVYWNGTRNCGIARCYLNCGSQFWRWAAITVADHTTWDDTDGPGFWFNHAGPVYSAPSAGECIDIRAWTATTSDPVPGEYVALIWLQNVHCS